MKREKFKKKRSSYLNLVELARHKSRYRPYSYEALRLFDSPCPSGHQSVWSNSTKLDESSRKRRTRSCRKKHHKPRTEINTSATYSSMGTQADTDLQEEPSGCNILIVELNNNIKKIKSENEIILDQDVSQTSKPCCSKHIKPQNVTVETPDVIKVESSKIITPRTSSKTLNNCRSHSFDEKAGSDEHNDEQVVVKDENENKILGC